MNAPFTDYTQANRLIEIATELGKDVLLLERLEVREGISSLFEMVASVRAKREDIQAADLVGESVDFSLQLGAGATRPWNGLAVALHEGPIIANGLRHYMLTVKPKLWLMTQRSDCRIFLNKTSLDIVETLCQEHGISDLDLSRVVSPPQPQPYSVQWNETDFAYLTRRLEEDGLFYWFEHSVGHHTLVVADHASGYRDAAEPTTRLAHGSSDRGHINDWRRTFIYTPGQRSGRDWNFETPNAIPQGMTPSLISLPGNTSSQLYEFPGRFLDPQAGEVATKLRMQSTEADFERVEGRSTVRTLAPGQRFTPVEVPHPDTVYAPQVITNILHRIDDPTYETNIGAPNYENDFAVMPASVPATPHRSTPRPRIDGLQIAVVAGPQGEEIHTDQYGRVKLTFPWDRRAKGDGTDTVWVRVGQTWAGTTWGAQVIPRVGMEVLVAYQEGDPDRPLVVGVVPNPNNPVPYDLPANKTRMTLRSNTYKGTGFNEMTFEDMTGQENLFVHAQKDQTTKIENNQTQSVGANHSNYIGQNQALTVGSNQTQEIGGSANLTVGGTGAGAAALMVPLAGMAGQTAGLLGEALSVAGGGGAGGLMSAAAGMMPQLASSAIGMLSGAGQQAQQNVGNGPSPRPDAGTALAQAGGALGQAAGGLFSLPGMMNTIVGTMKTDSIGVAHAMQIGTSQVVNVGSTQIENVGKAKGAVVGEQYNIEVGKTMTIQVGEALSIVVGKSSLTMDKDGNITLTGTNFSYSFSDHIQAYSTLIDLN